MLNIKVRTDAGTYELITGDLYTGYKDRLGNEIYDGDRVKRQCYKYRGGEKRAKNGCQYYTVWMIDGCRKAVGKTNMQNLDSISKDCEIV